MISADSTTPQHPLLPRWQLEAALYLSPWRTQYQLRRFVEEEIKRHVAAQLAAAAEREGQ